MPPSGLRGVFLGGRAAPAHTTAGSRPLLPALRRPFSRSCFPLPPHAHASAVFFSAPLASQRVYKGDYGFNVFHNSNPQHGGSYARHERRMRDDEVEDFLKSVKHWTPVHENVAGMEDVTEEDDHNVQRNESTIALNAKQGSTREKDTSSDTRDDQTPAPPSPSPLQLGEEAITRTFHFETFRDAYLFMGRVWAFCYSNDKYPHVTWNNTDITVYLYSPSFRGLSKREARLAAFLNDQYNMARKSKQQQRRIVENVVKQAAVEKLVGDDVAAMLAARQAQRTSPLREAVSGPNKWQQSISGSTPEVGRGE